MVERSVRPRRRDHGGTASGVPDDGGFRRSEERRRNRIEESEERVDLVTPCDCERTADSRKRIYDSLCKLVDTPAGALAFMDRAAITARGGGTGGRAIHSDREDSMILALELARMATLMRV